MVLWIGCGKSVENQEEKWIFRMNLDAGLESLDPAFASSRSPIWMCAQLFNGLLTQDSNFQAQPAIAQAWEISEDGLEYRFELREDVFFHKDDCFGDKLTRKVTAEDFVYSFTRICDPQAATKGAWIFNGKIRGLEAFKAGQAPSIDGFQAIDSFTFFIRLTQPFPPFLGLLATPYGYVVPREAVEAYGADFGRNPVGTGPFHLFRWKDGQHLILHRNPDYFEVDQSGNSLPYLDAVSVKFIASRLTAFVEFTQGNLDFIGDLDASYRDEVLTRDGGIQPRYASRYQFLLAPQLNTEYLGMQVDTSLDFVQDHPLADVRVRQALNYAIDRPKLVKYLLNGMGYPAESGFMPKGLPSHDPIAVPGYTFDPIRAQSLLAEAGFPGGEGLPELTLYSTDKYAAISEFIQKSFENIGVKLKVQNLQGGALRGQVYGVKVNFWRASWIADYPDGENYLSLFSSANFAPNGPNTTHFSSPEFDQLYQQTLEVSNDSLRRALYQELDRLMLAQAPIIPLYYDRSFRMLQPGISGLSSNPMNHLFLKSVKMGEAAD